MRKIIAVFCFLILVSLLTAQIDDTKTITKLEIEQKISERIEKLLQPFAGTLISIVELKLRYPVEKTMRTRDDKKSYYKDEVKKSSTSILQNKINSSSAHQIWIESMNIKIYLLRNVPDDMLEFVQERVSEWYDLDLAGADNLEITRSLTVPDKNEPEKPAEQKSVSPSQQVSVDQEQVKTPSNIWLYIIIAFIIIVSLIILNTILRTGLKDLTDSISTSSQGESRTISVKTEPAHPTDSNNSLLLKSTKNPLRVNVLHEDELKQLPEFSFLEELEIASFFELLKQDFDKNEISYIISTLSIEYVQQIMNYDSDQDLKELIESMMEETSLNKDDIMKLKEKVNGKFEKLIEKQAIKTDGSRLLISLINNLSAQKGKKVYEHINQVEPEIAEKIRADVFLFEDIFELEDAEIKQIIYGMERELLIAFLTCIDEKLRYRFIYNMSERTAKMTEEDLSITDELSETEKTEVIDQAFYLIKTVIEYI